MEKKLLALVMVFVMASSVSGRLVSADADGYSEGSNISTAFAGITLSSVGRSSGLDGFVYAYDDVLASTGTSVFGHNLTNHRQWYVDAPFPAPHHPDDFALRVDFDQPANSVSIDIIADNSWDYAMLYAYDSSGAQLEWDESPALMTAGEVFSASINRASFDIAYVIVGGMFANSATPVYLDNLTANIISESAMTYYVDAAKGSDNNDGLSPETPFATIQKAIDSAFNGDTVLVADGTYTGPGNRDIDFLGKAITVRSESSPENCIIDCNGTEAEPHRGFYFHNGEDANSVLDGITIRNGYAPVENLYGYEQSIGGAILCYQASPVISNCYFTNNSAGGIWGSGGAIGCRNSNPIITRCAITNNFILADWGDGAGISCEYSSPTINNCIIAGNRIELTPDSVEDGLGGGIYCYDSNPTIDNCIITGNLIYGQGWGGGIFCSYFSNPVISNCTFSGNTATRGGALHCDELTGPSVVNCILWGDNATYGPEISMTTVDWGSVLSVGFSNVEGGQAAVYDIDVLNWGPGNIDADPCFVEPGYWDSNGTPGDANDDLWVEGDYYLLPDSLCIDTGDPNYIAGPNETDLDGNPRVINGRIDMGAYETNYIQAEMKLTPQMLNCNSKGNWVKAHFVLPEGFLPEDVDVNEPAVAELIGIESEYIKVLGTGTGHVRLEICFDREAFCETITETGEVEITVIGSLTTSRYFYATDTIKIKPRR